MKKQLALLAALAIAGGVPVGMTSSQTATGFTAVAQTNKVTGVIRDAQGEPLIGATIKVKGTNRGTATDVDGKYSIVANRGDVLVVSYIGSKPMEVTVAGNALDIDMQANDQVLDEVVVTALGIRKDKKSLGYAVDDLKAEELMRNKSANAINSLSGKIAGVNITQSSGAAGSGAHIVLRGGTSVSENYDNQPLFVVDGVIYDNSAGVVGNSAFDGMMNSATTSSNRVMDINPEDIDNMSVLKGPAASALYGSRAANGVVIITTKKGKEGHTEVSFSGKMIASTVANLPKTQNQYTRGYMTDMYEKDAQGMSVWTGLDIKDDSYNSWGPKVPGLQTYDNLKNFFDTGIIWDTNLSVSGGTKNNNFFLSGSFYDQDGIVPTTGYTKTTFRFNGEQKVGRFTFGANAAYSDARTTKTLTGAALYGSSGTGALYAAYNWAPSDDMRHYLNEDGTRYRLFGDQIQPWEERDNPYWIVNKNKMTDDTERFTGNFNVKWDIFDWWWVSYRMGVDSYTTQSHNEIAPGGAIKQIWQRGMLSDNMYKYRYLSNNLMSNWNKQFGDFNINLMLGGATEYTKTRRDYESAWNFAVPEFYSYNNASDADKKFSHSMSRKRLASLFGEFRIDWRNAIFLTVTGRNDWDSTLPKEHWSYFYPSVSGAIAFTELFRESLPDWFSFGKIRASWAEVGKGTSPYETGTTLWPVSTFLDGLMGLGNSWVRGNPYLKPETTRSTEVGLELRFIQNRLKFDIAYYTNNSYDLILSPRGPQSTGYIFTSYNAGNVYNKGLEISLSGTPIQHENFIWETGINVYGNRGTIDNLYAGMDIMYVTDVQYAGAKAATFNGSNFMGISGTKWNRNSEGKLILDKNGFPTEDKKQDAFEVGDREPKFQGGWNNTFTFFKNWTFNMLWEFRYGGDVFNGTKYAMSMSGVSALSGDWRNDPLTIEGVFQTGTDDNGKPIYEAVSNTWKADQNYIFNGVETSGSTIIKNYYTGAYNYETRNWITNVKSLRLRTISLTYDVPRSFLARTKYIKRASITASANNLLLFTNYDGDPEVAAAGAGVGGSSSVGFDYCGVPATRQYALGINLTFGTDDAAPARVNNVELDNLNSQINDLRNQLANAQNASNARIAQLENDLAAANKALANCRNDLNAAKNAAPKVVDNSKQYMNVLVHFPVNKTGITADQRANVERVAAYLKSHPEATCEIKGYASPEGNQENNIKLANGRAASVKDMLVNKYGINANRIKSAGQGISNMFDELSWNRVSICEIIVK
ncbi:MAG: SusC/RagA family TonB-linked outer membrane protein [Bacteroidales bacterium]|nr:SusC/RagA family TonB-linked outer membrane protein [Bacteroidales bacterium]